jgi:hypothetical protein
MQVKQKANASNAVNAGSTKLPTPLEEERESHEQKRKICVRATRTRQQVQFCSSSIYRTVQIQNVLRKRPLSFEGTTRPYVTEDGALHDHRCEGTSQYHRVTTSVELSTTREATSWIVFQHFMEPEGSLPH